MIIVGKKNKKNLLHINLSTYHLINPQKPELGTRNKCCDNLTMF